MALRLPPRIPCSECGTPFWSRRGATLCLGCRHARRLAQRRVRRARRAPEPPRPPPAPPEPPEPVLLTPGDLALLAAHARPRTRGECEGGLRPCPWYGCRYHLGLELLGPLRQVRVLHEPDEWIGPTCALDVAEDGPQPLRRVGDLLGLTRERARQVEERALVRLREGETTAMAVVRAAEEDA